MQSLRYSINVTLDGCCDHRVVPADAELHHRAAETLAGADALLFGRITYQMMESAFRLPPGTPKAGPGEDPFPGIIDAGKKYVVSTQLKSVDWNAELLTGDLGEAVTRLKQMPGRGILVGGVKLPLALAALGLIDEYEFVVHPYVAGHGPSLFAGLPQPLSLNLVDRTEYRSGAMAMRYVPKH